MKIWQYTRLDPDAVGGVETHLASVSRELERLGHEVHIGSEQPRFKPEIVHTHGDSFPDPRMLWALRKSPGAAWIHVCHGTSVGRVIACREYLSFSGWKGSLRDFLPAKLADAAIAVSEQALAEARRYFRLSIPATVVPNGADPDSFAPLERLAGAPRIAFVGRAGDHVKNVDSILDALALARHRHPGLELWAAPGLEAAGAAKPFVRNLGPIHGKTLAAALAECRAVILCSFYEGDPIILREAQAMGLPVVVSDLPQIRQNLGGYANATFVNPHDLSSIAAGVERALFGDPDARPTPRLRAWSQVAKDFESFYRKIRQVQR